MDPDNPQRTRPTANPVESPDRGETLDRIERLLAEMRATLDALAREQRHERFSAARMVGVLLQVLAGGLLVLAAVDWILHPAGAWLLSTIGLAVFFQLAALTAFVISRER
jgi:hypothetical protein